MVERTVRSVQDLRSLVGQEIGVSDWLEINQERVNLFADVTEDHQFIHINPEAAVQSPFGGTVAHGFLTLSLTVMLRDRQPGLRWDPAPRMMVNYGLNRVRFPAPVRVGKRIRMRTRLIDVQEVGGNAVQLTLGDTVEIEGEAKPACVAEFLLRVYLSS
jgi:acyl dehydratase